MKKLTVIAFMLGEKCKVSEEAIAFFSTRYMTGEGNLYKDGELTNLDRVLDDEKVADVHEILHQICGYELGSNSYLPLDSEQLKQLSDKFEDDHPFCYDGIDEILNADNFTPGILVLTSDQDVSSAAEAYWKLASISLCEKVPHSYNLNGVFGQLENVAWMNRAVVKDEHVKFYQHKSRLLGETIQIESVDKLPQMTRYITPDGVRIADAKRVRLGAYIGKGTTVMHEGFINFNAGTLGESMVEGRISAGVVIGDGTDIGGGASIMGTLSGGNKEVLTLGENILLGANSGTGISLGNNCTIEAGLYLTAGTKVLLENGETVKASTLSKKPNLLFRRNSENGAVQVLENLNTIVLNEELHSND